MIHLLRRHPFPVVAHFRHSLVLAYAFPRERFEPLLPPGLVLDEYDGHAIGAAAFVQTEALRPAGLPRALGHDFFLSGYRIFVRREGAESLRGLYILRSDTDRRAMVAFGNLFTHYRYRHARVTLREELNRLELDVRTSGGEADLSVVAHLDDATLPEGSPFPDQRAARRYAGPLPHTFSYERETDSLVVIRATRSVWEPRPVRVEVRESAFFGNGTLANAFYVGDVDYRWERGRVEPLARK